MTLISNFPISSSLIYSMPVTLAFPQISPPTLMVTFWIIFPTCFFYQGVIYIERIYLFWSTVLCILPQSLATTPTKMWDSSISSKYFLVPLCSQIFPLLSSWQPWLPFAPVILSFWGRHIDGIIDSVETIHPCYCIYVVAGWYALSEHIGFLYTLTG